MQKIKVEQLSLLNVQPIDGGEELQQDSLSTARTKKQKRSTVSSSKYKVNVGGVTVKDVVDFISPSPESPHWEFITSDHRIIVATGNILVEYTDSINE